MNLMTSAAGGLALIAAVAAYASGEPEPAHATKAAILAAKNDPGQTFRVRHSGRKTECLNTQGAVIGTAFLATEESGASEYHRNR